MIIKIGALGVIFIFSQQVLAVTHAVSVSTSAIDCQTYSGGIRPGDIVVLKGPKRGKINFKNCKGTAEQPIQIKNDTQAAGPLIIEHSGDGFQTTCINCEYVNWDGTGKWVGAPAGLCGVSVVGGDYKLGRSHCGIIFRCISGSAHRGLRFSGSSKNFTVKGVELDGNFPACTSGIGLSINDHEYNVTDHPGEWREGMHILNNYIHHSGTSATYIGGNVNPEKGGAGDIPLRNNEIAFNYIDHPGCSGVKYKNVTAGLSRIHHNYVTNTGQSAGTLADGCDSAGIILFEAGFTDVYNNYIESPNPNSEGAGTCITQNIVHQSAVDVPKLPTRIFNNIVHNCKGSGISSLRKDQYASEPSPQIFNNTIVSPIGGTGLNVNSSISVCEVKNNIVADEKISASQCASARNISGTSLSMKFSDVSSKNFRLTSGSPAVDAGGAPCPVDDIWGVPRPAGAACDVGAFEFSNKMEPIRLTPPENLQVR